MWWARSWPLERPAATVSNCAGAAGRLHHLLKPAAETPLTANALAEVFAEVGLPEGVVGSAGRTGQALTSNPDIDMFTFTGARPSAEGRQAIPLRCSSRAP